MVSKRTKAGLAAAKASGQTFGRAPSIWKNGRGSQKRIDRLRHLEREGKLRREVDGQKILAIKAADLTADLNKHRGPKDAVITNVETVRRWAREGFHGLVDDE